MHANVLLIILVQRFRGKESPFAPPAKKIVRSLLTFVGLKKIFLNE